MNFFDFFRRKKPFVEGKAKVLLPDGKAASPQLAALFPKIERVALPCLRITVNASDNRLLTDSKFGGYPYWPTGKPYPVDSQGKYMYLLAQINFSQAPQLPDYPGKGLLQFYISADDVYGMNFDNPTEQSNFRVVYFEDMTATALEDFDFLDRQEQEGSLPLSRQMALEFTLDKDYYSFSDIRLENLVDKLMADVAPGKEQLSIEDELMELYPDTGHKIGGYAFFTQHDPRDDAYQDYILLLQIDSEGNEICWGDVGVGNFFIHPDDLKRNDFSRVLYNWDCT